MRKRRTVAKMRTIARHFLANENGACETGCLLSRYSSWHPEFFSEEDKQLLERLSAISVGLPIGKIAEEWHPDFLPAKLNELARRDDELRIDVTRLCNGMISRIDAWRKVRRSQFSRAKEDVI